MMGNYHIRFGLRIRGLIALSPTSLIITAHAFIMIFFMVNLLHQTNLIRFKINIVKFKKVSPNFSTKVRYYSTAPPSKIKNLNNYSSLLSFSLIYNTSNNLAL